MSPRPLEPTPTTGDPRLDGLARLLAIVDRLRAPDGCPWDREQTVATMAPSLIEEAFEAVEAIESGDHTVEELGDLLMVILLMGRIGEDEGRFHAGDLATAVGDKLVRRHPHVFGDAEVEGSEQVLSNWEKIKQEERREQEVDASALAGVPRALPALQRGDRLSQKAIAAGFRWNDADGALAKLREEVEELGEVLAAASPDPARIEAELGDVLMAGAFLGRYLKIDPERATRSALRRFEGRFRHMETALAGRLGEAPLDEMMRAWEAAKEARRAMERDPEESPSQ